MKKTLLGWMLLVCLLCISAASMAAYDERLPAGVNEILSGRAWDSYEVTKVDGHTEWGASRDVIAAILSKGERNILCLFTNASGEWRLVVKREKALYAGDQLVNLNFPDETLVISYHFDDRIEEYCFSPEGKKKEKWKMKWIRILTDVYTNPQTADRTAEVVEIKPTGDGLSYRGYREETDKPEIETAKKTIVPGVIYTDLPEGKTGSFCKDEKYPVYSGPSESYYRAANGKASVSTNDWIQVFGCENDMVLIQYAISSEKSRFGYIPAEAVQDRSQLEVLEPAYLPASVSKACGLTDDPLKTKGEIARLKDGEDVRYLATFGSEWTYVETLTEPLMRGFVPSESIMISE